MTRIWTPFGRSLAGLCLAVVLSGCASTLPNGTFGPYWPVGNGLSEEDKSGGVEGKPGSETEQPPFVGLYQTLQGPLLSRDGKLYSLSTGALKEWGKAPRSGMAWSIFMLSSQEGWSVGGEGIARYKNQLWEPVVNGSHELLSPATNNGVAVRLTDVAFSDAGRGFAVGTHGTVLEYANEKWTRVERPEFGTKHFGTVRTSGQEVWVAGEDVLRFNGTAWVKVGPPQAGLEVSGLLIRDDAVWASTGTDLWRWDRVAQKWDAKSHLSADYLGGLQAIPGNPASLLAVAMEVGVPGGRIFGLGSGGNWNALSPQTPVQVGLDSLVMLDHDTGFALSFDGAVLYKFDQGVWTTLPF